MRRKFKYSDELLEIDTQYSQYKAQTIEFKDYLTYLVKKANQEIIDILKTYTSSPLGYQKASSLGPSVDRTEIAESLEKTADTGMSSGVVLSHPVGFSSWML